MTGATSAEKFFLAGEEGLVSINTFSASPIWQWDESHLDVALSGEMVYALNLQGEVKAYSGPANIYPPETEINTIPATPQGNSGFYTSLPVVELKASDHESMAAVTYFSTGSNDEQIYTGSMTLPEGQYSFKTYSVDNHGYREIDRIRLFQIDQTPPTTLLLINNEPAKEGSYSGEIEISFSPGDNVGGVDVTEYRLGAGEWQPYITPLFYDSEESFEISFRSHDKAGNEEEVKTKQISFSPSGEGLLGDVDSNGTVNIVDSLLVAQYYVGLDPQGFNVSVADVDDDGDVDIIDALLIAQYYVGLITEF